MIHTRLGSRVSIVGRSKDYALLSDVEYGARVLIRYEETGNERVLYACDLRAEGGIREIAEAVFGAPYLPILNQGLEA